jgi:hypothetical protein
MLGAMGWSSSPSARSPSRVSSVLAPALAQLARKARGVGELVEMGNGWTTGALRATAIWAELEWTARSA